VWFNVFCQCFVILRNEGTHQKFRIVTLQYFVELLVCSFVPQDDKIVDVFYVYSAVWFNVFCQCFVILRNEGTHQKFRIATLQYVVDLLVCSFVPQDDKIVDVLYVYSAVWFNVFCQCFVTLRNEGTHQKFRIVTLQYFVKLPECSFVPQDDKIVGIWYVYSTVWFNVFCQCFVILRNEGTLR